MTVRAAKTATPVLIHAQPTAADLMTRTASTRTPRKNGLIELQCPECDTPVRVARDELTEGAPIQCTHCGVEAELRAEYDGFAHKKAWFLVDPSAEREEEERRT